MNNELYTMLTDDAQQLLSIAIAKLKAAQAELLKSNHIGVRLGNRRAEALIIDLNTARHKIDDLPAAENDQ